MDLLKQNLKKDIIFLKLLNRQVYSNIQEEELLDPDKYIFNGKEEALKINDYPGDYLIIEPNKIMSRRAESNRDNYNDFFINHDITNDNPLKFSFSGRINELSTTIYGLEMDIKEEILNKGITKYMPSIKLSGSEWHTPIYDFSFKRGIFNFSKSIDGACEKVIINMYPENNQDFITYMYRAGSTHELCLKIGLQKTDNYYQIYEKISCDKKGHSNILREGYYNDPYTESLKDILEYFNSVSNYQKLIKEINDITKHFINRFLGISTEDYLNEEIIDIFGIERIKMEYPNRVKSLDKFMIGKSKVRKRVR